MEAGAAMARVRAGAARAGAGLGAEMVGVMEAVGMAEEVMVEARMEVVETAEAAMAEEGREVAVMAVAMAVAARAVAEMVAVTAEGMVEVARAADVTVAATAEVGLGEVGLVAAGKGVAWKVAEETEGVATALAPLDSVVEAGGAREAQAMEEVVEGEGAVARAAAARVRACGRAVCVCVWRGEGGRRFLRV